MLEELQGCGPGWAQASFVRGAAVLFLDAGHVNTVCDAVRFTRASNSPFVRLMK